jgi:hypothetical protein
MTPTDSTSARNPKRPPVPPALRDRLRAHRWAKLLASACGTNRDAIPEDRRQPEDGTKSRPISQPSSRFAADPANGPKGRAGCGSEANR